MEIEFNNGLNTNDLERDHSSLDKDKLFELLHADSETLEFQGALEEYWEKSSGVGTFSATDELRILERIHNKLNINKFSINQNALNPIKKGISWYKVAAVLVPFILLGSLFYLYNSIKDHSMVKIECGKSQRIQTILPDGSRLWLNSGSCLTYNADFGKNLREVNLQGEAFFDIHPDKKHPFIVHASDVQIKVVGTRFNVLAYPSDPVIETTLESGSILYSDKENKAIAIRPGQHAVYTTKDGKLAVIEVKSTEVYSNWRENELSVKNESLENLLRKMEHWYGIKFDVPDKDLLTLHYTATIKAESIEQVLNLLQETSELDYSRKGDLITIRKRK
jgi:transmembrane sensor